MQVFVRPRVICELAGLSYPTVMRDVARFNWEKRKHQKSRLPYYSIGQVMESYGRQWTIEQIELAIARHNRPAAIESE